MSFLHRLNSLYAQKIYESNVAAGWWDDPNQCFYTKLQLISTEISEATEGERKNLMDEHLPHRKMGEVELADALIRTLDLGGRYDWEYCELIGASSYLYSTEISNISAQHLVLNLCLIHLVEAIYGNVEVAIPHCYSKLITSIIHVANSQGYDIEQAMIEKLEYNKTRIDHSREHRESEHGKKF